MAGVELTQNFKVPLRKSLEDLVSRTRDAVAKAEL